MNVGAKGMSTEMRAGLAAEAERTLRRIARLPAPEGIEERVKARLKTAGHGGKAIAWPGQRWMSSPLLRGAMAAAIVLLVGGGAWRVYSRVAGGAPAAAGVTPIAPRTGAQGGFSSAGAVRTPQTFNGPLLVKPVPRKKSGAAQAKEKVVADPNLGAGTAR